MRRQLLVIASLVLLAACSEPVTDDAERPLATAQTADDGSGLNSQAPPQDIAIRVEVEPYDGDPPGPCASNCDAILLEAEGLDPMQTYPCTTNIVASTGGPPLAGQLEADGSGTARFEVAYYDRTVYDEEYCVTLAEIEECVAGR